MNGPNLKTLGYMGTRGMRLATVLWLIKKMRLNINGFQGKCAQLLKEKANNDINNASRSISLSADIANIQRLYRVLDCVYTVPNYFLIRYNFVPAIRYSCVPARKEEEQFCTCTAPNLYRYSVSAREKEHFCIGSKVIRYSVNAALLSTHLKTTPPLIQCYTR